MAGVPIRAAPEVAAATRKSLRFTEPGYQKPESEFIQFEKRLIDDILMAFHGPGIGANMTERIAQLRTVSHRLVWSLAVLVAVGIPGAIIADGNGKPVPTPVVVLFVGFVGGFVGLQRRLKALSAEDLTLLANSWVCIALSPLAGAILAELVYLLFISNLLAGKMFPAFVPDDQNGPVQGLKAVFEVHCPTASDYAKVLFWSFVAGFSERFATNIISQFDSSESEKKPAEGEK